MRVIKDGLKCYNPTKSSVNAYLHRLLFVHRNTALRDGKTPTELLLGRPVRCPMLSRFTPMQELLYKPHKKASVKPVKFLIRQGHNTSLVVHEDGRTVTAHDAQLVPAAASDRPARNRRPVHRYPDVDPRTEGRDVASSD